MFEGLDEEVNVEFRIEGVLLEFVFVFKEYFELGEVFGYMDFEIVVKMFGFWFVVFKGVFVCLECVFV